MGGSDKTTAATIRVLRERGVEVEEFTRDSRELPVGLGGRVKAAVDGMYARGAVRDFEAVLRERRPDLVHVHELYPLISPWILPACTRAGVPVVMTCNDFRLSCPIATHFVHGEPCYRCLGGREHWCVARNCRSNIAESVAYAARNASARIAGLFERHVHRFVVISDFMREFFVDRLGIAPDRVSVNYCAITLPAAPVEDASAGGYVAYAGRFVREKGVEVMVEACRRAKLPMGFAGDADSHAAVGPGDDATFVMTRSRAELDAFYRGARVLVVPSLWVEAFGIVTAEAMSHGIPVVASRLGGLPGTVVDGETGFLAEPGNVADFADKIARIWSDPALARRMGQASRRRVEEVFAEQRHFERLMSDYRQVLAAASDGAAAREPARERC
jgi:glycosyltransferase involved in cell wall biosynthesis